MMDPGVATFLQETQRRGACVERVVVVAVFEMMDARCMSHMCSTVVRCLKWEGWRTGRYPDIVYMIIYT